MYLRRIARSTDLTHAAAPSRPAPRRGVAAVELAVVLPFLVTLLMGIWEVGRMVEVRQTLSNSAREGGRQAATGRLSSGQIKKVVRDYLRDAGLPSSKADVTIDNLDDQGQDIQNADPGDRLLVRVDLALQDVRYVDLYLVTDAQTMLSAESIWYSLNERNGSNK